MFWVQQEQRVLGEGPRIVRTAQGRLLPEISMISVDDEPEPVPSKSSTSSSTCVVFDLDEDAIGSECVQGTGWPSGMR